MERISACPICHEAVPVSPDLAGAIISCPHCAGLFTVPLPEGAQSRVPAPAPASPAPPIPRPASSTVRFSFACLRCGSILEAMSNQCGHSGRCPTCGNVFRVPDVDDLTGLATSPAADEEENQSPVPMHAYAAAGGKAPRIRRLQDGRQVIVCPRCQRDMAIELDRCTACGMPFTMEGAAENFEDQPEANSLAVFSMTLGILSLPTFCLPILGPMAIGFGIAGLARADKLGPRTPGKKMALFGMVCGGLSTLVGVVQLILRWL